MGLSPNEAGAAMLKIHPEYKVIPLPDARATLRPLSNNSKPPFQELRGAFYADPTHMLDQFEAYFTMPPTKQQAFAVTRTVPYPELGIERLKLIAALRQKYGPETKATHEWDKTKEGTGDGKITDMYWVYDEQGHVVPPGKDSSTWAQPAFNCAPLADSNKWTDMMNQYRLNTLPPASYCETVVIVTVHMGCSYGSPYCTQTRTEIDDHALLRRDAQIAGEAAKAQVQKQQQQQIDQSKQAKPSL